jgi:hypothetical protein
VNNISSVLIIVAIYLSSFNVQAQTVGLGMISPDTPPITGTLPGVHLVLNMGMAFGGDTIYKVNPDYYQNYNNYNDYNQCNNDNSSVLSCLMDADIMGGKGYQLGLGGLWQFEFIPVAVNFNTYYFIDYIRGRRGDFSFNNFPVEILVYYTGKKGYRFGAGSRKVKSIEASGIVNGQSDKIVFKDSNGYVAEMGIQANTHLWLNLRAVSQQFYGKSHIHGGTITSLSGTPPISGSHFSMNINFEF